MWNFFNQIILFPYNLFTQHEIIQRENNNNGKEEDGNEEQHYNKCNCLLHLVNIKEGDKVMVSCFNAEIR